MQNTNLDDSMVFNQIQSALVGGGAQDNQASKTSQMRNRQSSQMTSRRRWANPRQKEKYQHQCLKIGLHVVQQLLKKHVLRLQTQKWSSGAYLEKKSVENHFRFWKGQTDIEIRRRKMAKYRTIFKRLTDNIFNNKLQAFYHWLYMTKDQPEQTAGNEYSNFHVVINQHLVKT